MIVPQFIDNKWFPLDSVLFFGCTPSFLAQDSDEGREAGLQHMGDLMGWRTTFCPLPDGFTALERMVLTANGNLQRLVR